MSVRARWFAAALVALAAPAVVLVAPARAQTAQTEPTGPKATLSLASADPVTFAVENRTAKATVLVKNAGTSRATPRLRVYLGDSTDPVATRVGTPIESGDVGAVRVEFPVPGQGDERSGRLVVDDPSTADLPGVAAVVLADETPRVWPSAAVLGVAVLVAVLVVADVRRRLDPLLWGATWKEKRETRLTGLDDTWSFSASWASTITTFGAVLGTVLGSTAFAGEFLAGLSTAGFVALNLVWGGIALLAPVAYGAFTVEADGPKGVDVVYGTVRGLLFAARLTAVAVFGELGTLLLVASRSTLPTSAKLALVAAVVAAACLVGKYVRNNVMLTAIDAGGLATPVSIEEATSVARGVTHVGPRTVTQPVAVVRPRRSAIL